VAVVVSAGAGAVVAVGGAAPFAIVSVTSIEKQPAAGMVVALLDV
jgi:hypothetical protein